MNKPTFWRWFMVLTMGIILFTVPATTVHAQGIELSPANLDLGPRPIDAWKKADNFVITNTPGSGDFQITQSEITDNTGFLAVENPALPYVLAEGESVEIGISTPGSANDGDVFSGTYALFFDRTNRDAITATYEAVAYTPVEGNVWENPIIISDVNSGFYSGIVSTAPFYNVYDLPGASADGKNLVYEFTIPSDRMMTLRTRTTAGAKWAIYTPGFDGVGGPDTDNAFLSGTGDIVQYPIFAGTYYVVFSTTGAEFDIHINVRNDMPLPVAATNPVPANGANEITNGMNLEWTFGDFTEEYRLTLGTTYPPSTVVVDWTSSLTEEYTLSGLQPNMQYFWRIDSRNTTGTTTGEGWGFTTTIDVITGLTATVVDPAPTAATVTVNLDWNGPSDRSFIGYNVYRDGTQLNTNPITASEYTDLAIARNISHIYEVSTVFDEGESALSAPVSITTKGVGIFNGFVYDFLTSDPILGARVDIEGTAGAYSVLTAANGAYTTQAYAGTYSIEVSADDYTSQSIASVALAHGATVSNNFSLMETPYAVTEVIATELNANSVQVSWTGPRGIVSYDVWREKVYQPGTLEKIGNTLGQQNFVDFTWDTQDWGVYRWAVTVNYDENQVSDPTFSNTLDKDMTAVVNTTVTLNSGDSPAGTAVTFTNTSEPDLTLVYEETLGGSGQFTWNEFRKGAYNIDVVKAGYTTVNLTNVEIFGDESFNWLLNELLAPPSDLYVTPTGYATWGGSIGAGFQPMTQDFNDGFGDWTVQQTNPVRTWEIRTNASSNLDGTPYAYVQYQTNPQNELLVSPVVNATAATALYIQFEQYYRDYTASIDIGTVEVYDGSSWVTVATYQNQSYGSWTASNFQNIDVTAYKNANFQIRFRYIGHNDWYWAIDNVVVTDVPSRDRSFENYKVFLDGVLVADVTDAEYQFGTNGETLVDGQTYLAEVATVYSTGQSTKAAYTWTYNACDNYATPGNFSAEQVEGTINVDLSWTIPTIPAAEDQIDFARITRDGQVITETSAANYLDSNLDLGTYTYCITFVYESGAETCPATLCETVVVIGGGFVNGNVKEAAYLGGANISGAEVTLTNVADNSVVFTFTTNASGNYTGEVLAGTYDYAVVADGYVSQTLEDVTIAQTATVTHDFVMMEFPYAVGDIVATEMNDNTVEVNWTGTGGGGGPGGTTAEWLYYDDGNNVDGIGGPATFTWAIKFDPAQLAEYDGTSLTKISIYNRLSSPMTLRIAEGNNAATQVLEQTISGLPIEAWSEVTLTTPVLLDVTKQLWITVYSSDGANYPAAAGAGQNQPNGDLITLDGTTWEHLADLGLDFTWNLRGFVTDIRNSRTVELVGIENTTVYDSNPSITAFTASGEKNTSASASINNTTRELQGFNVYRTTCETGDLQFLGYTLDSIFTDNTWGNVEAGTYKWGVEAVYDENASEVSFSNCLDKDMVTAVSVTVATNSGDSPEGTDVTLTNTSEPGMNLVYEVSLDDTGYFAWEDFRKGTYDVLVEKNGFAPIMETVEIDGPINLSYTLEELLLPVTDLHVSPTGYATWTPAGVTPFANFSENFDEGIPETWTIVDGGTTTDTWYMETPAGNPQTSGASIDGTPFAFVDSDEAGSGVTLDEMLVSPVIDASGADELYLEFDQYYNILLTTEFAKVDVFNGTEWVNVLNQTADAGSWANPDHKVIDVTEYINDAFQVRFHFFDNGSWTWYWAVDNVVLTDVAPGDRALQYYKVWLDGTFIADVPTTFYQYDVATLTPGQEYFSEVAAVYSNGMSEKMNYTWTYYPCDSFPGPADLAYEVVDVNNVVLTWGGSGPPPPPPGDGFADDFEDHTNFAIDFAPWTNVDVDGSTTYGMNGIDWLNEYAAQSFIVFNPSATSPALDDTPAHSGSKFVACFAAEVAPNNDWLISPSVTIENGNTVSFWAKSYTGDYGLERFKVGVSTTGLNPSDFTIISSGSYVEAPATAWTEFSYDLSSYAGQSVYVGIQCVSNDAFFLMVDDFAIGAPSAASFAFNPSVTEAGNATKATREKNATMANNTPDYSMYSGDVEFVAEHNRPANGIEIGFQNNQTREAVEIHYDNGYDNNAVGTDGAVTFMSAVRFTSDELGSYYGDYELTDVKFIIHDDLFTNVTVKVWEGGSYGNPGTEVYSQDVTSQVTATTMTTATLSSAVALTQGNEYWIGYSVTTTGGFPAAVDAGPMVAGKGAWMYFNDAWDELTNIAASLDYNWVIRGVINTTNGGGGGGGIPEGVLGANVYRNGELIAEMVQGETYTDLAVEPGYYDYCVVFVYEDNAMSCMTSCVTDVLVTEDCKVPQNLTATEGEANEVTLEWNTDNFQGLYLSYGSGIYSDALGLTDFSPITVAIQFDPATLAQYDGRVFSKVNMYYGTGSIGDVTVQIWEGTTLIREEAVTSTINGESWNEIVLNQPVLIDGTKSYRIGYTVANYDGFPAGAQDYMGNPNSDLVLLGGAWDHISNYLPYSWLLEAYVSSASSATSDYVALTSKVINSTGTASLVSAPSVDLSRGNEGRSTRAFLGYNIYRNGSLFVPLWPETTYVYQEGNGGESCYTVTAEYEYCGETDPSNEACVTLVDVKTTDLSQIRVYPNPTNSTVNIELTPNVSQVVIYNYLGQVVLENNITDETTLRINVSNYEAGAYLVKFITSEGHSLTKKVVVSK